MELATRDVVVINSNEQNPRLFIGYIAFRGLPLTTILALSYLFMS